MRPWSLTILLNMSDADARNVPRYQERQEDMHPNPIATGSETSISDTADISPEAVELMAKHGITRTSVDIFRYGEFRYTTLSDAVAEAKRHPVRG